MTESTTAVERVIEGELRLLDLEGRRDPEVFEALLHEEFTEFGASGRIWDRASMVAALHENGLHEGVPIIASNMSGVQLAEDLVQLTFDTDSNGRCAHRSSLWRLTAKGWQLWFHQATLFTPES
ncbi:nuclear transport factor 2 family protein [Streptomyces sp. TRM66268-LWL]|uniref:Nuclear transport factor 2 family protein n=1 Tax=Streptomyces polyasparticus TaxID=2767826 RepID=A0ABR7SF84_9ACTN|nr:nuclear transport factor 2 family protein [Streptomyces polyasparticus]MBC9713018.1 nuclear transport factor 2 family protein [Streptomyces polyasparticus]